MMNTINLSSEAKELLLSNMEQLLTEKTKERKRLLAVKLEVTTEPFMQGFLFRNVQFLREIDEKIKKNETDGETAIGIMLQLR